MTTRIAFLVALFAVLGSPPLSAQQLGRGPKAQKIPLAPVRNMPAITLKAPVFTFARIRYSTAGRGHSGWATDWPDADLNFTAYFQAATGVKVGDPKVFELTDPNLKGHSFIYVAEGGQMHLKPEEVKSLREYLLSGGFLMVDDFWGEAEWAAVAAEFERVFPGKKPIDLP